MPLVQVFQSLFYWISLHFDVLEDYFTIMSLGA